MEIIVDQLKSVNSKSLTDDVKTPENIKKLILKNFNKVTDWNELKKFNNLEFIELTNCYVDSTVFFKTICEHKKLNTFKYDYFTFFKKNENKDLFKFNHLKKIIFEFPNENEPNLSLIDFYDRADKVKHFINFLPSFPTAYQTVNEIELINYEAFFKTLKKQYLEYTFEEVFKGKDIYFQCDIYNFLRLKNLKNIILFNSDKFYGEKNIINKIFSLPNNKKITINNNKIEDFKKKIITADTLFLKFKDMEESDLYGERGLTRDPSNKDIVVASWAAQKFFGYENQFKEILKSNLSNVVLETALQFLSQNFDYDGGTIDFLDEEILKIKSLKSLTLIFDYEEEWNEHDRTYSGYIFDIIKKTIKRKIKFIIKFKNIKTKTDLNKNYYKYIEIFNYYLNCQKNTKLKQFIEIEYLNFSDVQEFVNQIYLNELKTIIVIDNKSKSKTLKKFKDIELLDAYLDDPGYFQIFEGIVSMEKLTEENELSFVDFYDYTFYETNWNIEDFRKNPGCCIPIVKKSFLDQSKEIIFDNLECITFYHVDVDEFPNYEEIYQNKKFEFPKSINSKNIKKFGIHSCEPLSLSFFNKFKNLEDLYFSNYVDQNEEDCWNFATLKKLKKLKLTTYYPFIKEVGDRNINKVTGIENCISLENLILDVGYTVDYEDYRWNLLGIDISKFDNLKKLKDLTIFSIDQTLLKELPKLEALEYLKISNPCMVTDHMNPDDKISHDPLTENDFKFLKHSKNLKSLEINFPKWRGEIINIEVNNFLNLINKDIEEIKISCSYYKDKLNQVHNWYDGLTSNFNKIKSLSLDASCYDVKIDKTYSNEYNSPYQIELRKREENAKNPIFIDFKEINKLNKLSNLKVNLRESIGTRFKNINQIKKSNISLEINPTKITKEFLEEIFELIATKREKFLIDLQKNNLEEDITSYKLEEKDKEKYNKIAEEAESNFQINGKSIFNLLKEEIRKISN